MKKMYWMGLFATLLAWGGCSEEDGLNPENGGNKPMDEQTYLTVRIMDAGASTRGTAGNPEFEDGTADEHYVTGARFFFYDNDKEYVTEANVWDGGDVDKTDDNIEFNGNTVIVLNGLEDQTFPKYMVTVLNAPADYQPGETLDAMLKTLSGGIYQGKTFIMSTTSYVHNANADVSTTPYFVTELTTANFQEEPIPTTVNDNVVKVYVERLAAKVLLEVSDQIDNKESNGLYKLNVTVAGDDNNDVENGTTAGADIYVKLLGWGLNATAKNSYMMKNIDKNWKSEATGLGFSWNDASKFRSYWGMSYNYGDAETAYPDNAEDVEADTNDELKLEYISANKIETAVDGKTPNYCAENTFPEAIASTAAARTSILLKAQICNDSGKGLDMVRYNGMLFKKDHYLSYVLNALSNSNSLNAWHQTKAAEGTEPAEYAQIDKSLVELANLGDGKVKIQLKKKTPTTGETVTTEKPLYKRTGTGTQQDPYKFEPFTATDITDVDNTLASFNANNPATGYNGGLMYYNIPIEHLRAIVTGEDLKEANYGVVRNHYYKVTINKLENVGKGIFDPDEAIVPGDDDEIYYYVGASIHILSWKIVNQEVDL